MVSTHSHPKVAAQRDQRDRDKIISFNTQPPEGGCELMEIDYLNNALVSTHSHPKVAALLHLPSHQILICFNTQPPEGGCKFLLKITLSSYVSTHSHPKVAAHG